MQARMLRTKPGSSPVSRKSWTRMTRNPESNQAVASSSVKDSPPKTRQDNKPIDSPEQTNATTAKQDYSSMLMSREKAVKDLRKEKERKAAKTLAIITGVFIICWLPFFVLVFLQAVLNQPVSKLLSSLFLWLGYVNSLLNPVIYTIFSPDFRSTFKRMLPCQRKSRTRNADKVFPS